MRVARPVAVLLLCPMRFQALLWARKARALLARLPPREGQQAEQAQQQQQQPWTERPQLSEAVALLEAGGILPCDANTFASLKG